MANPFDQFDTTTTALVSTPESFKKEYYTAAKKAGDELGVDPNIILGQWGNETGWGKSIVPGTNNLGNIKGKGVEAKDNQTGSVDQYKKYSSVDDFANDYVRLIKSNYPKSVGAGKDPDKFLKGLKGYAEDQQYPAKIKAASQVESKQPNPKNPFDQFDDTTPVKPVIPEKKPVNKDYAAGSSGKATFGESLRDVGQAALGVGSSMVGGMAGLAAEAGSMAFSPITEPKSMGGLGVDPYQLKNKIANALTYEPKTEGAKKLADIASIPGKVMGYPLEQLNKVLPESAKPMADVAYNALLPQIPGAIGETIRKATVGGDTARAAMKENIADFKRAGVKPYSLGQVSEGGTTEGAGSTKGLIEKQREQLGKTAEKVADRMSSVKSPEEAGKIIREAIGGTPEVKGISPRKGASPQMVETGKKIGGYIDNARSMEDSLYDKMYKVVGKDTKFWYPKLFQTLNDLTRQNPNLMATSGHFISKGLLDLKARLVDDVGKPRKLGYEDARWLRSKIGELTDPRQIVPNDTSRLAISPAQADSLYAAMSEDMMRGVQKLGPKAELATLKANQFSRNLHKEIGEHLQPVMNSKLNQDLFNNAISGTKDGAERVRSIMKTLDPMQKDAVKSVFFRELGRNGDQWDTNKFFREYGKLHSDAKTEMFGGPGKTKFRNDLDAISRVANKLNVDENTWHKVKTYMLAHDKLSMAAAVGVVSGVLSHSILPIFLAGPAMGFITGNMIRNPAFIDWFAKSSKTARPSAVPLLLNNLKQREKDMSPEDKQETDDYINKVQSQYAGGTQ